MSMSAEARPDARRAVEEAVAERIVGRSPAMQIVRQRVVALGGLNVPVLVRGEPGAGRSHVVRALHAVSEASALELVRVAPTEAQRFARVADAKRVVVLEDVARFAPADQARYAELLGRSEQGRSDAPGRVFATTSRDLAQRARAGEFDPAFAIALQRFAIELPALRDRREDVAALARTLAAAAAERMGRASVSLTVQASRTLAAQSWPGNVRELAGVIERLVAFCDGERVTRAQVTAVLAEAPVGVVSSRRQRVRRQREELIALIEQAGGNLAEVARRLDMSRGGVIYRAQKFGLLPKRGG